MFSTIGNKNGWILCAKVVLFFLVFSALLLSLPFTKVNGQNLDELEEILREVREGGDVDVEYSEEHIEIGVVERMQLENDDVSEDEVFTQNGHGEVAKESFSIESPKQGETVVNTNLSLTGKAPRGTLVHINIKDEDTENRWMKHLPVPFINGTVTSDESGNWVFIPQQTLVPGYYSVVASYNNPATGTVSSERLYFSVADAMGKTKLFKIPSEFIVVTTILVFIVASFLVYIYLKNRKRLKEQERFVEGELVEGPRQPPSGLPAPGHYQPVQPQFQSPVPQQMNEPNINPQSPVSQIQVNEPVAQSQEIFPSIADPRQVYVDEPKANKPEIPNKMNEPMLHSQQLADKNDSQHMQGMVAPGPVLSNQLEGVPENRENISTIQNEGVSAQALPKMKESEASDYNSLNKDDLVTRTLENDLNASEIDDPEELSKRLKETMDAADEYEKKILSSAEKAGKALKTLRDLKRRIESDEPVSAISTLQESSSGSLDGFDYKRILEEELGLDSKEEVFGLKDTLGNDSQFFSQDSEGNNIDTPTFN